MNKKEKKMRLRKGRVAMLVGAGMGVLALGGWFAWSWMNPILLKDTQPVLQVNSDYDPADNIASVFYGDKADVEISPKLDTSQIGTVNITYTFRGRSCTIPVQIADMKAPELSVQDLTLDLTTEVDAESFVLSCTDETRTSLRILNPEDVLFHEGTRTIQIQAMDEFGNKTVMNATLTRKLDPQAPTIEGLPDVMDWPLDIDWIAPEATARDDKDGLLDVHVDDSSLNVHEAGDYTVTFSAVDQSGNTSQKDVTVRIRQEDPVASTGGN